MHNPQKIIQQDSQKLQGKPWTFTMSASEQEALKVKHYYSYQKNRTDGNVLEQVFYFL